MAGVKGRGGPPPKRSDQRRRTNTPAAGKPTKAPSSAPAAAGGAFEPPPDLCTNPQWHATAKRWYEALAQSGQARFYEPSDWATAYLLAESISRELKPQPVKTMAGVEMVSMPVKGASLAAWLRGMTALMVTEGDRRRSALELQHPQPAGEDTTPSPITDLRSWRQGLGG